MSRLIDADALLIDMAKHTIVTDDLYGMGIMAGVDSTIKTIAKQPTIDAVTVVHGRWDAKGYCTNCGNRCIGNDYEEWRTKYCPYCGAKMKGTFRLD